MAMSTYDITTGKTVGGSRNIVRGIAVLSRDSDGSSSKSNGNSGTHIELIELR